MDQLNQAHLLLAGPADTDQEFYHRAAQAIAVATDCRWGGVCFSRSDTSQLEVVALWEKDAPPSSFCFDINGSPCELVYSAPLDKAHVYFPRDVYKRFSGCELLGDLGVESYRGQAFYGDDNRVLGHIFALHDGPHPDSPEVRFFFGLLSQRMSAEYRRFSRQDELRRLSSMIGITRNMMSFVDKDYRYRAVSQGYVDTFGMPREEMIGKRVEEVHGADVFQGILKPVLDRSFDGDSINTRHWIYPPEKPGKYLDVWQTPYTETDGTVTGVVVSGHDITRQKQVEETLQKLSLAVTHSPVLTVITDPEGVIEYVSPIVEKITGYRQSEVIGHTPSLFKSGRTDEKVYQELWGAIKNKQAWSGELENRRKNGEYYWESISIAPVLDENGKLTAFVGISMDISQRKLMEQQLQELACSDPLTGIFNRRHFLQELDQQLDHSRRYGMPLSLMIIDIDNFKQLNDSGGHALGDEAILQFVTVCDKTIRTVDIFGRMGGDEFAIAMPETAVEEAAVLAERLRSLVMALKISHDGSDARMTVSIGLSSFIAREDRDSTIERFLKRADKALYKAKRQGRNRIAIF
ncbi:MAG: diguanylate cyclase [Sedimenticola sp.]|nr:diguanylate cyclase [Sedimenticola sp.]